MSSRFILLSLLAAAACSDAATTPHASRTPVAATATRVPINAPVNAPADRATLAELRAPWAWIGALHHEAMQEALHDPNTARYTSRGPDSPACAAQLEYMKRYAARAGAALAADADIETLGRGVGVCTVTSLASTLPDNGVGRYATILVNDLRGARSLDDAFARIDDVLLQAAHDPDITPAELSNIAAMTVVAISSVQEWSAVATTKASIGRSPALNAHALAWTFGVSSSDVDGCAAASSTYGCAIGSIGGSVFSWL